MTLKEIAERAGVSTATVSYVLNASGKVGEATREKVLRIIEETGYRSNMLAKGLRSGRSNLIGVLVEDVTAKNVPAIIDGISSAAEKCGCQTMLGNLRLLSKIDPNTDDMAAYRDEIDRAMDTFRSMRVDGVIYVGMHDRKIPHIFREDDIPLVYCYCYTEGEGSSVCYDNMGAAYEIARRFLDAGHRKIAVMAGRKDSDPNRRRLAGIKRAIEEYGLLFSESEIYSGNWDYETSRGIALEVLRRENRPRAFIALNDEMAVGIRDAAAELQITIPDELSLSGFDNDDVIRYELPKITTVDRPLIRMGMRAMEILLGKVGQYNAENVNVVLPCTVVEGASICNVQQTKPGISSSG